MQQLGEFLEGVDAHLMDFSKRVNVMVGVQEATPRLELLMLLAPLVMQKVWSLGLLLCYHL